MMKTIKILTGQIREYKKAAFLTPLCMTGEVVCEMMIPLLMATIIDQGVEKSNMHVILTVGGKMLILALCGLAFGLLGGVFAARASAGLAKNLRKFMFDRIQDFSFSNIDHYSTASLVTRLTTDVTNIQNAFQMILRMFTRAPLSLIIAMTMSFSISPSLSGIYLVAVILLGGSLFLIMTRAIKWFQQIFPRYDDLNESIDENVTGIRIVKAFERQDYEIQKEKKASLNIYRLFVKAENMLTGIPPLMQITVYTTILLISWFGAKKIVAGSLTTGELMSLLTYCMNILTSLMMMSMILVMVTISQASAERIAEVLTEKSNLVNPEHPDYELTDGSVSFDHVDFSYAKGTGRPVLSDIHLSIASGEVIGIIGSTGSAKTSLVNLLSRLYDVTKGTVKVGGKDVRSYDLKTLRDKVAVVLQKNLLFSGTILENLRWGNENATLEECKRACRIACADEFIERMPAKYDTYIEQGGSNVSGGQRQRLCIARALLKNPKILILDDSTSAVDTATEAKIRKGLRDYLPETTKITIAQRISSIENADRVIVMDDGQVNGFDTPENLMKNNRIYREVYESQTQGNADFDQEKDPDRMPMKAGEMKS